MKDAKEAEEARIRNYQNEPNGSAMLAKATKPRNASSKFLAVVVSLALVIALMPAMAFSLPSDAVDASDSSFASKLAAEAAAVQEKANAKYRNSGIISDLFSYDNVDEQVRGLSTRAATLPDTFDLRNSTEYGNVVTSVKLQNPWGTCWGFAATTASETSILSELGLQAQDESGNDTLNFSERHLAWFAHTPLSQESVDAADQLSGKNQIGEGAYMLDSSGSEASDNEHIFSGDQLLTATSVYSSGIGPVDETIAPYQNDEGYMADGYGKYTDGKPGSSEPFCWLGTDPTLNPTWSVQDHLRFYQSYELEESIQMPDPASSDSAGTYVYNEEGTKAIKQELAQGRAVAVTYYADQAGVYYRSDTCAQYAYERVNADHAVAIVGWDDTYSASNFLEGHQPDKDGAWIVKNSWGSSANEFPNKTSWGKEGYFYLSYYDQTICAPEALDFDVEKSSSGADYYLIDQYDYMTQGRLTPIPSTERTSTANVFQAAERQSVRSLSCQTPNDNMTVTFDLYRLNGGATSPLDGTKLATVEETFEYAGYHRVELDRGYLIEEGGAYSVVVTMQSVSSDGSDAFWIPLKVALNKTGALFSNAASYSKGIVNKGESYVITYNASTPEIEDLTAVIAECEKKPSYQTPNGEMATSFDNFAIKAYADPAPRTYEEETFTASVDTELGQLAVNVTGMVGTDAQLGLQVTSMTAAEAAATFASATYDGLGKPFASLVSEWSDKMEGLVGAGTLVAPAAESPTVAFEIHFVDLATGEAVSPTDPRLSQTDPFAVCIDPAAAILGSNDLRSVLGVHFPENGRSLNYAIDMLDDGSFTITVDSLSPFALYTAHLQQSGGGSSDTPNAPAATNLAKTGDTSALCGLVFLLLVSLLVAAFAVRHRRVG